MDTSGDRTQIGLTVEMLPAGHGDCVLVEWPVLGAEPGRVFRMLVDCGPASAYDAISARLAQLEPRSVDVLVLTHIDADHIEGTILLVNDAGLGLDIGEVWYNGSPQLTDELSAPQGEILGAIISVRKLPWNALFGGKAVRSRPGERLPHVELPGPVTVTVLAPATPDLLALRDTWERACAKANLHMRSIEQALQELRKKRFLNPLDAYLDAPAVDVARLARQATPIDSSVTNRSSIVLLLEGHGRSVLLTGDSTPGVMTEALRRLAADRGEAAVAVDVFKVPHHGSAKSVVSEIVRLAPARHYLFSSDGAHHGHPDDVAVARVIQHGPVGAELVFNYDSPHTRKWEDDTVRDTYQVRTRYPQPGDAGVRITVGSADD